MNRVREMRHTFDNERVVRDPYRRTQRIGTGEEGRVDEERVHAALNLLDGEKKRRRRRAPFW
jgi:hypothetical protein